MSDPGPRSAWDSPGFLLWHATLRWQRVIAAALRPLGLTHVQFVLLAGAWWLAQGQQRPTQRELADHAGVDPMMTSQVVRTLESRDLLRRELDEFDARVRRLAVTPDGERLAVRAIAAVEATDHAYFASVSDREGLMGLLRGLAGREAAPLAS